MIWVLIETSLTPRSLTAVWCFIFTKGCS